MLSAETTTAPVLPSPPGTEDLVSLGLYVFIATGIILLLMILARLLGQRTSSQQKSEPYESAILPTGTARLGQPVPFYLVAIFFIIFDLEAVFIVSWAIAYDLLGWAGFAQISFFIVILFLGLVYLWKKGGLDWGSEAARRQLLARRGR